MSKRKDSSAQRATEAFFAGKQQLAKVALFNPLLWHARFVRHENNLCPAEGWAVVTTNGDIHTHPARIADPEEWCHVLAHCLLHLAFDHFQVRRNFNAWNTACDAVIERFLQDLHIGRPPESLRLERSLAVPDEARLYERFVREGIEENYGNLGTGAPGGNDMIVEQLRPRSVGNQNDWPKWFASGLVMAVGDAVQSAAGLDRDTATGGKSEAECARAWFMASYPLLGALAAAFKIVEDEQTCVRYEIVVAAVSAEQREIYLNPRAGLSDDELRFVLAHELLHVALRHHARREWRDPYLWNVACDFVINEWLTEMGVGHIPPFGGLLDPDLKGLNAESIYDIIVTDLRRFRKHGTLRGVGRADMLDGDPDWWLRGEGVRLDDFYRRCLCQGLEYHNNQGRGWLPGGLVEEIRALSQPPVPWDVELARWFDVHFPPVERHHSYARLSRRQSSTPDIPRPRYVPDLRHTDGRTFGVVLDTSGSMASALLARGLGAIASYSMAHDVVAVRVVFCDAIAYDKGYMAPEEIAGRVQVRGRGGTVLQPGIDLLVKTDDFPKNGPLLIITDGLCEESLFIPREHALLVPRGNRLSFRPKGPVFWMTE